VAIKTEQANESYKTSIIILSYNNIWYTRGCIESIRLNTEPESYELIVVDNNSTDGTCDWLLQQSDIKCILNSENAGFPKGCNQGITEANPQNDILLLNNDTVVTTNWLTNLHSCLYSGQEIGAVGAVTNSCSNFQVMVYPYIGLAELAAFAQKNNISDSSRWEERLFENVTQVLRLVAQSFTMLIICSFPNELTEQLRRLLPTFTIKAANNLVIIKQNTAEQ